MTQFPEVEYDHDQHIDAHSLDGAAETLRTLFPGDLPQAILDVGCGTGHWLKAAVELGAQQVWGVDGVDLPREMLFVDKSLVRRANLEKPLNLERRFDLVLCLETVEHLSPNSAETIIDSLVVHGDLILFSAAAPGQVGFHHVNCRWPAYWQELFNQRGYVCDDSARWAIWDNPLVEPWYRQNLFMAHRDIDRAGQEPRIPAVLHPAMEPPTWDSHLALIERGALPIGWYVTKFPQAVARKLRRRVSGQHEG